MSEYMAGALWYRDAKKSGFDEGVAQGIAQQKAEDEKLIAKERNRVAQKDALLSSKDSEVARQAKEIVQQAERIKQLEAMLLQQKNKR